MARSSPWLELRDPDSKSRSRKLVSKVGERSDIDLSTLIAAGECMGSSIEVIDIDGATDAVYCDSVAETIESTLCLPTGGSLPLRLSVPLPLLLVLLVGVSPGLPRFWLPDSASLNRFEASLSLRRRRGQNRGKMDLNTGMHTLRWRGVLELEFVEVRLVLSVLRRLFILREVAQVLILDCLCLRLEWLLLSWRQVLPILTNQLGDLGEAQVAALELIAHLFIMGFRVSRAFHRR